MTLADNLITGGVLIGIFLLAYSAIRHKDIKDILIEIKDLIQGKTEEVKESVQFANVR